MRVCQKYRNKSAKIFPQRAENRSAENTKAKRLRYISVYLLKDYALLFLVNPHNTLENVHTKPQIDKYKIKIGIS